MTEPGAFVRDQIVRFVDADTSLVALVVDETGQAHAAIKVLRGLIPLCPGCKKVKSDDGYWQAVDSYISKHSEAEVTHWLCEDCAKKHYPEYFPGNS